MSEAMRAFFEGRGWPAANLGEPSPELIAAVEAEARRAPEHLIAADDPLLDPRSGYIYLASPYSHADAAVRVERYRAAVAFAAWTAERGFVVYSPIVHWHEPALMGGLPTDAAFWWRINRTMLAHAAALWVLQIDGWELSRGLRQEVDAAQDACLPISAFRPSRVLGFIGDPWGAVRVPEEVR